MAAAGWILYQMNTVSAGDFSYCSCPAGDGLDVGTDWHWTETAAGGSKRHNQSVRPSEVTSRNCTVGW